MSLCSLPATSSRRLACHTWNAKEDLRNLSASWDLHQVIPRRAHGVLLAKNAPKKCQNELASKASPCEKSSGTPSQNTAISKPPTAAWLRTAAQARGTPPRSGPFCIRARKTCFLRMVCSCPLCSCPPNQRNGIDTLLLGLCPGTVVVYLFLLDPIKLQKPRFTDKMRVQETTIDIVPILPCSQAGSRAPEALAVGPPDSSSTAETTLWSSTFRLMTFKTQMRQDVAGKTAPFRPRPPAKDASRVHSPEPCPQLPHWSANARASCSSFVIQPIACRTNPLIQLGLHAERPYLSDAALHRLLHIHESPFAFPGHASIPPRNPKHHTKNSQLRATGPPYPGSPSTHLRL